MLVLLCVVLATFPHGPSGQEVSWAAYNNIIHAGQLVPVPVGPGCEQCYVIGCDVLHYKNFQLFQKDYDDDDND